MFYYTDAKTKQTLVKETKITEEDIKDFKEELKDYKMKQKTKELENNMDYLLFRYPLFEVILFQEFKRQAEIFLEDGTNAHYIDKMIFEGEDKTEFCKKVIEKASQYEQVAFDLIKKRREFEKNL